MDRVGSQKNEMKCQNKINGPKTINPFDKVSNNQSLKFSTTVTFANILDLF